MASPELNVNLLSKSSPSQLPAFQFKRSRTQPIPTEAFYSSQQKAAAAAAAANSKTSNLSHVPCKFYKQGTCTAGANCTFSHSSDLSSESAVCKYFVKGNCKFGTKCALLHTMSPYGMDRKARPTPPQIATPPVPQLPTSLAATGRRKTDQVYSTSNEHRMFLDSFGGSDPFATSAPSFSLLRQLDDQQQQMWRSNTPSSNTLSTTPRTSLPSNDFIGLNPSPRESSDHLLGSSPFSNRQQQQQQQQQQYPISSSLRSNASNGFYQNGGSNGNLLGGVNVSGLADSHLGYSINRSQHSMMMNNEDNNNSNNNDYININNGNNSYHSHLANSHSNNNSNSNHTNGGGGGGGGIYDLNDAMLPSSLNDLFTPTELHVRRVRQQEQYPLSYSPSRESNMLPVMSDSLPNWSSSSVDVAHYSTLDNMQKQQQKQWRVPFLQKSQQQQQQQQLQQQLQQQQQQQHQQHQYDLASDYEDMLVEGTGAINIPGGKSINNINGSNNNSGSGSTNSHYLQQQQDDLHHHLLTPAAVVAQDDEVQFFMEDDEAVTYDTNGHKITENNMTNNKTSSNAYPFPSFVALPTSSIS